MLILRPDSEEPTPLKDLPACLTRDETAPPFLAAAAAEGKADVDSDDDTMVDIVPKERMTPRPGPPRKGLREQWTAQPNVSPRQV